FIARTSTVTFTAAGARTIATGNDAFYNARFTGSGSWTLTQDSMTVISSMTLTNGTLDASASNCSGGSCGIAVGGDWTVGSAGVFTARTSTVALTGAAAQTVSHNGQAFAFLVDSNTT